MEALSRYVLSVICAGVLAGMLSALIPATGPTGGLIRFLSGVYLIITLIQPLIGFNFSGLEELLIPVGSVWDSPAEKGEELAREAAAERIRAELTTYILDKASALGGELQVDIRFNEDPVPLPLAVVLTGSISDRGKASLTRVLEEELGIAKENQRWNTKG